MKLFKKVILSLITTILISTSSFAMNLDTEITSEPNDISCINEFPDEILQIIFSELSNLKDLLSIRRVCKCWNEIANNPSVIRTLLKKQILTRRPTHEELSNVEAFKKYLKEQRFLFTGRYFSLLRDFEISEIQKILINLVTEPTYGQTLLNLACWYNLPVIQELLQNDANVNAATNDGTTPLDIAAQNGHLPIVQELLNNGAHVNAARNYGTTPLLIAAQNGHLPIVQELLNNGAHVNAARTSGATPLYIAAQNGHLKVVQELLKHPRIDVNAAMLDGTTPLDIAKKYGHHEIVKLLNPQQGRFNRFVTDLKNALTLFGNKPNGHEKTK